jgi:hypothetical protein
MAEYVVLLMREGPPAAELEIVDRIGELPKTTEQKRDRLHLSFASKLAHFFIDPERFPIYDQYAARALAFHTGKRVIKERGMRYADYCEPFEKLRSAVGVKPRELDQYLWLRGLYHKWKRYCHRCRRVRRLPSTPSSRRNRANGRPGGRRSLASGGHAATSERRWRRARAPPSPDTRRHSISPDCLQLCAF